jgi:hypothetical protein
MNKCIFLNDKMKGFLRAKLHNLYLRPMTPILEIISKQQLPGWLLLKNATLSRAEGFGQRIGGFEEYFWENSWEKISQHLPQPVLLANREARELAAWRFSEEEIQAGRFTFDTLPNALLNEGNDKDVFGSSWTIFWVVPPDKDRIIALVCEALTTLSGDSKILDIHIDEVWKTRVNRLFVAHRDDLDSLQLMEIHEAVENELVDAVNAMENAPEEAAWEILNDDFPWDEDFG